MKQLKRFLVFALMIAVVGMFTACGNTDSTTKTEDANGKETEKAMESADPDANDAKDHTEDPATKTDQNDSSDKNTAGEVIEDVGNGVEDGVDSVIDGVEDVGEDITGNGDHATGTPTAEGNR